MSIDVGKYLDSHGSANGRSYDGAMMGKGKVGEAAIMRWLQDRPDVLEVDDYRSLRAMQKADVDCAIYTDDGTVTLAELKTDHFLKNGGNVTFEFLRINHTAPPDRSCVLGWTARTPAKWVIFFAPSENLAYRFETEVMRSTFQAFTKDSRPERGEWFQSLPQLKMRWISTDAIKSTLIACIPLTAFPKGAIRAYDVSRYL